jgi:3-deoxy-7-phosphoheptulonate synthase
MIVVMDEGASEDIVEAVISRLVSSGCDVHRSSGTVRTILGIVGDVSREERSVIGEMPGVARVVPISAPYRLASTRVRGHPTIVEGDWGRIGGERSWIAVEAIGLPNTSRSGDERPDALPYVIASGRPFDAAVSRSIEPPDQIGALACLTLHSAPRTSRWPVTFVSRDPVWGPDEWLVAAERELDRGASRVVLLESGGRQPGGLRTFDVAALARTRALTHLPIVADVPTIAERAAEVPAVASAAIAAGAQGVVLRAGLSSDPCGPLAPSTLTWSGAVELAERLHAIGEALAR